VAGIVHGGKAAANRGTPKLARIRMEFHFRSPPRLQIRRTRFRRGLPCNARRRSDNDCFRRHALNNSSSAHTLRRRRVRS